MGIGPLGSVSLSMARAKAQAARDQLAVGIDPLETKREQEEVIAVQPKPVELTDAGVPKFGEFAAAYIDAQQEGWKCKKYANQWRNTLKTHAASLTAMPVDEITTKDVLAVLKPIWMKLPVTAANVRARIETILDAAKASGHITSPWENPARSRGNLVHMLPRQRHGKKIKHHAAIPYEELPAFFEKIMKNPSPIARALELTILCAARTSEILNARWREFDLTQKIWTIPADRMKMGVEHRIPLTDRCIAILEIQRRNSTPAADSFVFPGQRAGRPYCNLVMFFLMRRMKMNRYTVHGMRSAFRDYCGDMTDHSETIIEMALAHQVGDGTVRAYRRRDAFQKRSLLMNDWARYVLSQTGLERGADPSFV